MHTAASCFTPFGCHKYTFWCKLTRIPRLHNTVLVFFYPIQIRIVSGSHYCGVNVHHVGVTFTLNWCSHSCKNLHFFGVTITLALFLCVDFGKACPVNKGVFYKLPNKKEKQKYLKNFPHLAPELVDGDSPQNTVTDIYSLGYTKKSFE